MGSPYWSARATRFFAPYLESLNLQSPYRFYAPNPGCDPAIWFRISYSDQSVRWVELPPVQSIWMRMAHHRMMSLASAAVETTAAAEGSGEQISPMAQLFLASYVRHMARTNPRVGSDGRPRPVQSLHVFSVHHRCMTPAEARSGWGFNDLRLHWAYDLGEYSPNGVREVGTDHVISVDLPELVAWIIQKDVAPAARNLRNQEALTPRLAEAGIPAPITYLLQQYPQLVHETQGNLAQRIRDAVDGWKPENGPVHANPPATNPRVS
jgi:hypothetical protein